jgi:hypothetical protein
MKRKYSINDCEKLIDRLFNSYNISLKECSKKRDELKNIGVNWGKKNYDHQTLEDFFLSNSVWSIDELENTGFFLEDVKEEKQEVEIDKAETSKVNLFFERLTLSILAPVLLFFIFFFVALKISSIYQQNFSDYWDWENEVNAFSWETIIVWILYIFCIVKIEQKLYKFRKKSKYIDKPFTKILFYISIILTVVTAIFVLMAMSVQLFSRIGSSSRDNAEIIILSCFLIPMIFWTIYYFFYKNRDAIAKYINDIKKQNVEKNQALKRKEAMNEIKKYKELLDLDIISQNEYDKKTENLKQIILNN